jgi:hypothetical protein
VRPKSVLVDEREDVDEDNEVTEEESGGNKALL